MQDPFKSVSHDAHKRMSSRNAPSRSPGRENDTLSLPPLCPDRVPDLCRKERSIPSFNPVSPDPSNPREAGFAASRQSRTLSRIDWEAVVYHDYTDRVDIHAATSI